MRSPGRPFPARGVEREFWRLIAQGKSTEDAAAAIGVSVPVGSRWFRHAGGMPPVSLTEPTGRYLSFSERGELALLRAGGLGVRAIAREMGRDPSTISRELRRNAATRGLPSEPAGRMAHRRRRDPRTGHRRPRHRHLRHGPSMTDPDAYLHRQPEPHRRAVGGILTNGVDDRSLLSC